MSKRIEYKSKSGQPTQGEITEPAGAGKVPALIVIQEWWGVNDHIRSLVDRFAKEGFLAFAPDLFQGKTTTSAAEAGQLLQGLDRPRAMDEVAGAAQLLRTHARSNGKVGIVGFCMGGGIAFAAAASIEGLGAAVPFYGLPDPKTDFSKCRAPIQAHFAERDDWATAAGAEAIKTQLGKHNVAMELHVYDAGHAFMNDARPEAYIAPAAKQAWERAIAFLHKHLG